MDTSRPPVTQPKLLDCETRRDSSGLVAPENEALESLLTSILSAVPDGMIVINERGVIIAFSSTAERMFGYSAEEMRGHNVAELMTDADSSHHDAYVHNYLATGKRKIIGIGRVVSARTASGEVIPVELKIGEAQIGGQRFFVGFVRDLTEKQRAEHRIRQMQAELINFSRLSAVGTMASAMAHELNQPLTAVTNYLEAARDMLSEEDHEHIRIARQALDGAARQAIRAGQIIRRLRDYVSRGEITTRRIKLAPLIHDAATLALVGVPEPVARITESVETNLPDVMADRVQIQQVIVNLIRNAVEATAGELNAEIEVRAHAHSPTEVVVCVSDNGPGFNEEDAANVFRPFSSTKPSGMGLGLSICQTIVESHNGRIWLEPTAPHGATFCFTLERADTTLHD